MATSGTVATTVIDTVKVLEHAFRRVGLTPSALTPETWSIAKENLYFLLLNLSNRGLNLWAVEKAWIGLQSGKATYDTPAGTLDLVNVTYSTPTVETSTFAATASGGTAQLGAATAIIRSGFTLSTAFTGTIRIRQSADGATYTTVMALPSQSYAADTWYWQDLVASTSNIYFSVDAAAAPYPVVSSIRLVSQVADLPMSIWNRDTYMAIPNKMQPGSPSTSYFFEKKLTPTITIWPVPNNNTNHLTVIRHRQPQDVGGMTDQLEIPQRWMDGIIWLLASRLCFEIPGVDAQRGQMVMQMAQQQEFEAELSETDGSPVIFNTGIGVYTR